MKINIAQISPEGLTLEEEISAGELDLNVEGVQFCQPIKVRVYISRITNAVTLELSLTSIMRLNCSRCLAQFEANLHKNLRLNYQADASLSKIDLNPDIREEIILDYPLKPLCRPDCKGLCPNCGQNLNEGGCSCGST